MVQSGVLCDISGVLKTSVEGCDKAIGRSIEAFDRFVPCHSIMYIV